MAKAKKNEKTFKTGEACKELDVQPYVLRYWETEFPMISGRKSGSQKVYSERDLEVLRRIKELLYDEGYTIAGAKKRIEAELDDDQVAEASVAPSGTGSSAGASKREVVEAGKSKSRKATDQEAASLDTVSRQSIESVLPELRKLHREAVDILELVRG